jgi:hypothetical protein
MSTTPKIKIFLSSTYTDLSAIRTKVSEWLAGVFGADLIIMETFGSEAAPPDVNSVRRVRSCDLFVGIYAHRYGTVDQATGKSIVELELDEAKRAFSSGVLNDILLYLIDEASPWPNEHRETSQVAETGLKRLKQKARQHTVTFFKREDDLLFFISRDVYRRLAERIGASPFMVRQFVLPAPRTLHQPVGMEFLTSENQNYLVGREQAIEELMTRFDDDCIVLLLGDSGVGKTSLIHAGLIPKVTKQGWRAIYTRPLGYPCTDIIRQIQTSVFETRPPHRGSLLHLLAEVSAALKEEKTLLIIDQFEDVLVTREDREISELTYQLRNIRELAIPSVHILVCYRSDLEGRLGGYWQEISGSPLGFPRVYLSGVNEDEAWCGVTKAAQDLSVTLKLSTYEEKRIKNDLLAIGHAMGLSNVYPPYLQMLVDHIWSSSKKAKGTYTFKHYQESGGMDGVIGGYLNRLLEYAQDAEGNARLVLVSLVRSYGVKAQKSIDDIVADTGLDQLMCEVALKRLIDLRLVRHLDDYYEISHDFIAKQIASTLVDSEEREFKRFRELLTSKAAAYQITAAPLTPEEILMLYKHKERVVPDESELRLLLSSWVQRKGPALYWLLGADPAKVIEWLRAEENKEDIDRDKKVSIVLLRKNLGESPLIDDDYLALRHYQLSTELANLILEDPLSVPNKLVIAGLRHRREEVKEACIETIVVKIQNNDLSWINLLYKSSSTSYRGAYRILVLRDDVPIPERNETTSRSMELFIILKKMASAQNSSETLLLWGSLLKMRPPLWVMLFGKAIMYIKDGKIGPLLREARKISKEDAELLLDAVGIGITPDAFNTMVTTYEKWNSKEKRGRYETSAINVKSNALARAIFRSMSHNNLARLRTAIKTIRLTRSSREVVHSLLEYGNLNDFKLVLDRIATEAEEVYYWNHTRLGRAAARQLEKKVKKMPRFLVDIASRKEFWDYIFTKERGKYSSKDLLPIKSVENRSLYIRLAAYGMIGVAKTEDKDLLLKLTEHSYSLIATAAAIRLTRVLGKDALRNLVTRVDDSIQSGHSESLAVVLRSAEMELFGIISLW